MVTRISSSLIEQVTYEVVNNSGRFSEGASDATPFPLEPDVVHQPLADSPLEILRASIIRYGDLISPIEEDGWEPGP